jgi:hypothetical protein
VIAGYLWLVLDELGWELDFVVFEKGDVPEMFGGIVQDSFNNKFTENKIFVTIFFSTK